MPNLFAGAGNDPAKRVVGDVLELWIDIWLHFTDAQRKRLSLDRGTGAPTHCLCHQTSTMASSQRPMNCYHRNTVRAPLGSGGPGALEYGGWLTAAAVRRPTPDICAMSIAPRLTRPTVVGASGAA